MRRTLNDLFREDHPIAEAITKMASMGQVQAKQFRTQPRANYKGVKITFANPNTAGLIGKYPWELYAFIDIGGNNVTLFAWNEITMTWIG